MKGSTMTINNTKNWVALLDGDEDDFVFWQYGFQTWAADVELKWFVAAELFLSEACKAECKPMAIILDGIVPKGEEKTWLSTFLGHVCCHDTPVFMLAGQFKEEDQQSYLALGATGYLIKPTSSEELQKIILKVTGRESSD
jgi:DNA-binding response OmpR family regulator